MGAFYLIIHKDQSKSSKLRSKVESALADQGFEVTTRVANASFEFGLCPSQVSGALQFVEHGSDNFDCLLGTACIGGRTGIAALDQLAKINLDHPDWQQPGGNFCAITARNGILRLFVDRLGVFKTYTDASHTVFSSSFLAVARTQPSLHADPQGVYEYVHQEATFGGTTVVREVSVVDPAGYYEISGKCQHVAWTRDPEPEKPASINDAAELCLNYLRRTFATIAGDFRAVDTALSGGYDTRLALALLQEQGINPSLHVYGRATDADVVIASRVAASQNLDLKHIDKSSFRQVSPEHFATVVERNFQAFDGYPNDGIFDSGADLATRQERAAGEKLMLNGGGGEVMRNFFYLPDRKFSALALVKTFFSRYHPRWCTSQFDEHSYLGKLADKMLVTLGHSTADIRTPLPRPAIEMLYPAFRCGYWMGRNNSVNSRLGWVLTPFVDYDFARFCSGIPLAFKNYGRLEAKLIREISPSLAACPSDYGHDFSSDPPLRRIIKDNATICRPIAVRPYTYRLRYSKPHALPEHLQPHYLEQVLDPTYPAMTAFFHPERFNDPGALTRLATLEYLFTRLNIRT